jgi:hypothetical protein
MQGPETANEPIGICHRVSHQVAQVSFGASRESLSKVVVGNLTLLKCAIKKSRGEAPLQRGRQIERMPGNGLQVLQMGMIKGCIHHFLPSYHHHC